MSAFNKTFDLEREITVDKTLYADLLLSVPASNIDDNLTDLSITLGSKTLSDTFNLSTVDLGLSIGEEVEGTLKDFNYKFVVEEINEQNKRFSYTGNYDINKLHYTNYSVTVRRYYSDNAPSTIGLNSRTIMEGLCSCLGLNLDYKGMEWTYPLPQIGSSGNFYTYGLRGTYANVIGQLFGWLSDLPHIDFNVFIRGSYLHVLQRGHEDGTTYAIQNIGFPYSIQKHKVRTEWQGGGQAELPQRELDTPEEKEPFSGTIAFGDTSLTYQNGYLMEEKRGHATTTYTYEDKKDGQGNTQKYLSVKETVNDDNETCAKTEYYYQTWGNEIYLCREVVYTDGDYVNHVKDYDDAEVTTTTHSPINNGYYGVTVYDKEGEVVSTSLSQGAPGNTVTQYMVDKINDNMNQAWRDVTQDIIDLALYFAHPPLTNTNYPVSDRSTLEALINATDWLDGRTEERVTFDVLNSNHIFDFNDILTFKGNTYKLESNNITKTAENGLRQHLEIVRWY